jgi:hypothetical protein
VGQIATELSEIQDTRVRRTAVTTLTWVAACCLIFMIRAILWEIDVRIVTTALAGLVCTLAAWNIHRGYRHDPWAYLAVFAIAVAAGGGTYTSGGITSMGMGWLPILPLIGGLVGGLRAGIAALIFSLLVGGCLWVMDITGGAPPT